MMMMETVSGAMTSFTSSSHETQIRRDSETSDCTGVLLVAER